MHNKSDNGITTANYARNKKEKFDFQAEGHEREI